MSSTSTVLTTTADGECGGATTIFALPPDILTHILTLLDGPSLASASCASAHFHALSSHPPIWHRLCRSTWPSSDTPRVTHLISTFPSSYRSFFSDAFSTFSSLQPLPPRVLHPPTSHLISAVDLRCGDTSIFSKVLETETQSSWYSTSPFRIDALDRKDPTPQPVSCNDLAADLVLTWIVIDPVRTRAVNLSSIRPVSVQRHWLSGETQVRFATILGSGTGSDWVQCGVVVTCGGGCEGERGGGVKVSEVSLQVEDMDGMSLNGRDSLGILQRAMGGERKRRREEGEEMRERYLEYLKMKKERKEKKKRREVRLDMVCLLFGFSIFSAFLGFLSLM